MESKECRIVVTWLKWQIRQNNAQLFVRQKSGNSDLNYSWLAVVLRGISISIWVYARLSAEFFWQRVGICTQRVGILLFRRKREEERDFYLHWNIWLMLNTFESEFFSLFCGWVFGNTFCLLLFSLPVEDDLRVYYYKTNDFYLTADL